MEYANSSSSPTPSVQESTEIAVSPPWNVVVHNDPVNLMSYVVMVFCKVFGYDKSRATRHMMEVHERGKSILWTGELERAETYVYTLQSWKLNAQLEQDG